MVWRPFMRQMGKIVETRSILGTRIRQWMAGTAERICAKFTLKTCLVLRSGEFECQGKRSKVNVTRDKNALCTQNTPSLCGRNGTPSLQITARTQQTRRFDRCRGAGMRALGLAGYRWALPRISSTMPNITSLTSL